MLRVGVVRLRHASPADAEAIWRISTEAYAAFRDLVRPRFRALQERPELIAAEIDSLQSVYGLALVEDKPIGHVRYKVRDGYLAISRLAVLPAHRGQDVGLLLMRWLEDEARRWDMRCMRGEVRSMFPGLLRYYLSMGYRVVGRISLGGVPGCLTRIQKVVEERSEGEDIGMSEFPDRGLNRWKVWRMDWNLLHPAVQRFLADRVVAQRESKLSR